jgi:thioredoxin-related protein
LCKHIVKNESLRGAQEFLTEKSVNLAKTRVDTARQPPQALDSEHHMPDKDPGLARELYFSAQQLAAALTKAHDEKRVVAALYTSEHCPFCIAIKREQLTPRMRSSVAPGILVVEFDVDDRTPISLPNGARMTVKEWGRQHGLKLTPTMIMLDYNATPLTDPLVGYSSRDYYAVYLEDHIQSAQRRLQPKARP